MCLFLISFSINFPDLLVDYYNGNFRLCFDETKRKGVCCVGEGTCIVLSVPLESVCHNAFPIQGAAAEAQANSEEKGYWVIKMKFKVIVLRQFFALKNPC